MNKILFLLYLPLCTFGQLQAKREIQHWQQQADRIIIVRDNWGVPHIYGKTDADAAFGLMYAQCEDNYWQLEEYTIRLLGRAAEIYGEKDLEGDAAVALFECVKKGKETYVKADPFLKTLCGAAAAGINFYLYKHPDTEKRLLGKYEPWFFLVPPPLYPASHGITQNETRNVFTRSISKTLSEGDEEELVQEESGSNTIALSPAKSKSGNSMLLINPHVPFFGGGQRYEAHLVSDQGLNVSGFAGFGNFYIWAGFNTYAGWAHTDTFSDYEDVYLERFSHPFDSTLYRYGDGYRKAVVWHDTLLYKEGNGLKKKVFIFQKTRHGPVMAQRDSFRVTMRCARNNTARYILQAWAMCKAKNLKEFTAAMANVQLATNTMYADRFGNIAYWHGNAVPKRDEKFNWRLPVDGSNPQTEWKGIHSLNDIIQVINPASGWIQNCNSTPFKAAGLSSPKKENYPPYMSNESQNFRAEEAIRLLSPQGKISFAEFEQLALSNHLPMMAEWLPQIITAYEREVSRQPLQHLNFKEIVDTLRKWDYRYSTTSKATTLAAFWFASYMDWVRPNLKMWMPGDYTANRVYGKNFPAPDSIAVQTLHRAADTLIKRYGTAFISWGEINRLQRIHTSGVLEKFDDNKMSLPVGAVPPLMGSLFAFETRTEPQQKKMYGVKGNSYVAIIEFGKRLKAKSIVYFGQSANPTSQHYFDQAPLYAEGKFKDVYFYKEDVEKHAERKYHPGE